MEPEKEVAIAATAVQVECVYYNAVNGKVHVPHPGDVTLAHGHPSMSSEVIVPVTR